MRINNYDTELEELLDCPFCGSRPVAYLTGTEFSKKIYITIKCPRCLVVRKTGAFLNSLTWLEDRAIELWNNRI